MKKIFPAKLKSGDKIRIIAPSRSMGIITEESRAIANERFQQLGFTLSFGKHIEEMDDFASSSIESRLEDLHDAFSDKNVKGIFTVIGGFNANQLLQYIDWGIIQNNPKVFCGFSDITALNNAIFAKTGLVTYSGPHYSTFGQKKLLDYTSLYLQKCVMSDSPFSIEPSNHWTDDEWWKNQEIQNLVPNDSHWILQKGKAQGTIVGANLCTLNLLQGTEYMPELSDSILFLEDDSESQAHAFDRDLVSLIQQNGFKGVRGIVVGRFQKTSKITRQLLQQIISSKKELSQLPVIANVDFGHTEPKITFPVGGHARIEADENASIIIDQH